MKNQLKLLVGTAFLVLNIYSTQAQSYKDKPFLDSDWTLIYEKEGITVSEHKPKNRDLVVFKAEGVLKAPLRPILSNLREVEKSTEWTPKLKEKSTLLDVSDVEAITYNDNDLPWPVKDRDMVLTNKLYLDKEEAYLIVETHSVDFPSMPARPDRVRATIDYGTMAFRPLQEDRTWVQLIILVDPKGAIPKWLVNILQRSMPFDFLKALEKRSQDIRPEVKPGIQKLVDGLNEILKKKKDQKTTAM
ncbi:START domain-containing protein [Halobacteriovorax sp. GB3]|uniref:START domain-containing protein n=1 Tax=Halobacteriovorax sp. GB3 TaxID=2719615 RepID=UPI00235E66CC|nr:START domain-containing protein [Halobacteriovorax sp. GB3]MDD0853033.1 START domain-containing protein [Halobacteriovorax sp. GB3]